MSQMLCPLCDNCIIIDGLTLQRGKEYGGVKLMPCKLMAEFYQSYRFNVLAASCSHICFTCEQNVLRLLSKYMYV